MKLVDHVTFYSTKEKPLWSVKLVSCVNHIMLIYWKLDAGQHAGYEGLASLPFYDDFDLSTVDVLLISQ